MPLGIIQNLTRPLEIPLRVRVCSSYWERLRGLMFHPRLAPYEGILLVEPEEGRFQAAIHMLFMQFDIAVVWINRAGRVVDVRHARPWKVIYMPQQPASYILEIHPIHLSHFGVSDEIEITIL